MSKLRQRYMLWLQYGLLSLAIMAPLLLPGYILTLDLVFAPHLAWPSELSNTYVFEALLHAINLVLPSDVIEKLVLLLVLLLAGVGMHRLVEVTRSHVPELNTHIRWGAYFAGMLYMINPFVYSRFMAGQHFVLLGYALMPFFVLSLVKLVVKPNWRTALCAAMWATAIAGVSIHYVGVVVLFAVIALCGAIWRYRNLLKHLGRLAKWTGLTAVIAFVANSYWLIPTLLGSTTIAHATAQFGQAHQEAFATDSGALGVLGNVLRLQGFWLESRNMFTLPQEQLPIWGLVMIILWVLVGFGLFVGAKRHRFMTCLVGAAAVISVVLAATPLIAWLSGFLPFIAGYREPQKLVGILALAYAYFGALGVIWLLSKVPQKTVGSLQIAAIGLLLVPLLTAPTMLWGFSGQLTPRHYPEDWFAVNKQLVNDTSATKTLFLPWHQYMYFDFAGRIIANPAAKFFDKPVVISDDPEYKNVGPAVPNVLNRNIELDILALGDTTTHIGETLEMLGFSHVILAKEYDFAKYAYLDAQSDLQLERETPTLKVYKVTTKKEVTNE